MAILAEIIDLDELFDNLPQTPILVNDFNIASDQDKEQLDQQIMTQYGSDFLEVQPSCRCGATKGGRFKGVKCHICYTEVAPVTERPLESSVWIAPPAGVKAFINPKIYAILSDRLTFSRFNILEHLVKPDAPGPETKSPVVVKYMKLSDAGVFPRGINYFYDHFDEIMDRLVKEGILKRDPEDKLTNSGRLSTLLDFLRMYRDMVFCQHIPLPTQLLMITEKTPMTTFASQTMFPAIDAVRIISATESSATPLSPKFLQARAMKANALMAQYNEEIFEKFFDQKSGWIRQHIYGTRSHFTARAVINSLTDPHDYEEIHLPWALSVMLFRIHLASKLINQRGFSLKEAQTLLDENTLRYHPILDELFQEMIRESPGGKIPILLNRNPSLVRGAIQQLFITKVKTDVEVKSISISALILKNFNADFDGDALNLLLILDNRMLRKLNRLAPHHTVLDTNKPWALSRAMQMPEPIVTTINSFIHRNN